MTSTDSPDGRPLVTIAIPTYNRGALAREVALMGLAQTYSGVEVLVCDNASSDDTPAQLASIPDPRLRVIRQATNIGQNGNWNACVREARGEYIVLVSDDDAIDPWFVERCAALIRQEPGLPLVVALGDVYFAVVDRKAPARPNPELGTGVHDGRAVLRHFLEGRLPVQMCTVLMHTDSLRARGGFRPDWPYADDLAAWVPALLDGRVGVVNERCGTYCVHAGRTTSSLAIDTLLSDLRKLAQAICAQATARLPEGDERREVESLARRYLGRHAFGYIASHRRGGTGFVTTLGTLWRWRRELSGMSARDLLAARGSVAAILTPLPLRHLARRIRNRKPGRAIPGTR